MNSPHAKRQFVRSVPTSLRLSALLAVAVVLLVPLALQGTPPAWWYERGVIDQSQAPNDYAALNQGQLKNIATQAAGELDAHLPGGIGTPAGANLRMLLDTWTNPSSTTNDYAAVNLGQLKSVAKPFYDLLKSVGYTNTYPWTGHESSANDYAAANIGQAKNLFSFGLTSANAANDLDGDGIADWWERHYFPTTYPNGTFDPHALAARGGGLTNLQAFQQGLNPNDFYNGHVPALAMVSGDGQLGSPGHFVTQPLVVSVKDAAGNILIGAPVRFTVGPGGGQVQTSSHGSPGASTTVLTDAQGRASVYFQLPNTPSAISHIVASTVGGTQNPTATFTETADDGSKGDIYGSPFGLDGVTATVNPDGSADVTWNKIVDPGSQTTIQIQERNADGQWVTVGTADINATSFHINP